MRLMNDIFKDCLDKFVILCLDDILIFSQTHKAHLQHLEHVFHPIQQNQLYVNLFKCFFLKH